LPLRGQNADFRPLSKFNTGSLPPVGNPAGKKWHFLEERRTVYRWCM